VYYHKVIQRTFFCVFIVLAGCGSRKEPEIRIAVGGQAQLIYLPAIMAQQLGFYQEAGLNVSQIEFQGGAKALEAMMGGSADVVCGFYDHTIQMAAEGKNLEAFVAILRYPGVVLVSPDITSIEKLRGKNIGVTSLGSSSHMLVNYLLIRHGLKPEDVSTAAIGGGSTAVGAVTHHKVDAAIMTDPALTIVRPRRIRRRNIPGDGSLFENGVDRKE
jgi:NitT/TauT family transport system substrate-binding protein